MQKWVAQFNNNIMPPKNTTARPTCGNPLLLQWIGEWMEHARNQNSKGYYTYKKAYDSVLRCPLTFQHPSEAEQLSGIGPGIVARLEKKFIEHYEALGEPVLRRPTGGSYRKRKTREAAVLEAESPEPPPKKLKRRAQIYIPQYRSGAYAILLALLAEHDRRLDDEISYLTKTNIVRLAQPHCDASFDMPETAGSSYTAWNSMKTLLEKDYVYKNGSPTRFILTETGLAVARQLAEVGNSAGAGATEAAKEVIESRRSKNKQVEQHDDDEDDGDQLEELQGDSWGGPQGRVNGVSNNHTSFLSTVPGNNAFSSTSSIGIPKMGSEISMSSYREEDTDENIFQYSYLTSEGTRVRRKDEADVRIDESTFTVTYRVQFPRAQAAHPFADYILIDGSLEGHLTGYLDEAQAQDISPGLPAASSARAWHLKTRLQNNSTAALRLSQPPPPSSSQPRTATSTNLTSSSSSASASALSIHRAIAPVPSALPHADSKTAPSILTFPPITPTIFHPGTFEIVLVLDTREVRQKKDRDYIQGRLLEHGVRVVVRSLELGDVVWVARRTEDEEELVLDYVLERKRADDLVASIKDGRFKEQKFRLSNSGASQIIYVIEEYNFEEVRQFGLQAIQSAMSSTQVVDGFFLKRTSTIDGTIDYLVGMHTLLKKTYEVWDTVFIIRSYIDYGGKGLTEPRNKTLHGIPDKHINRPTFLALKRHLSITQPHGTPHLVTYHSFGELNSKSGTLTLGDLFVKMLMTVRGVSAEKATEIAKRYGTPRGLLTAYDALREEEQRKRMVKEATEGSIARRKIGLNLSKKVCQVWFAHEY
ncbi:hypothetical protein BC936DRAFT_145256 [Jimgerdemannia flammicorona]|uniref:Crossover junction endonuclease MUS81 n=1 Tax=Jimgerdemannia flammicorona TaxID=994334 RepID=A0A433DAK0_9FUNG|nr:hypothetical protein BC936DRAFT_145256 [Jimgerdemannia flammicorona]